MEYFTSHRSVCFILARKVAMLTWSSFESHFVYNPSYFSTRPQMKMLK